MRQYTVVYGNKTAEAQSAQRTNERRRLLLRSKYAILFKYCSETAAAHPRRKRRGIRGAAA